MLAILETSLVLKFLVRRLCVLPAMLLSVMVIAMPVHASDDPDESQATAVVDELHSALLETMRGGADAGYHGRYDIMAPVVTDLFDTQLIARVILGRYWDDLDDSDKDQFIDVFRRLSTATYAHQFDRYSGESFTHAGVEPLTRGRLLVKTEMLQGNGDRVRFDYLMHKRDGNWYIISVVANGVNDLSLKRAEYASVIRSRGFDSLIRELEGKISEYEAGTSG